MLYQVIEEHKGFVDLVIAESSNKAEMEKLLCELCNSADNKNPYYLIECSGYEEIPM